MIDVLISAYNVAPYLEQTVHSVLQQDRAVIGHIYICDDCSQDHTGDISEKFASETNGLVKHIRHDHNIGATGNIRQSLAHVTSPYVAFLDGDDYWHDHEKLRFQMQMLKKYPELSACSHAMLRVNPEGAVIGIQNNYGKNSDSVEIITKNHRIPFDLTYFHQNTLVVKKDLIQKILIPEFDALYFPDLILNYFILDFSDILALSRAMASYRVNSLNSFTSQTDFRKHYQVLQTILRVEKFLGNKNDRLLIETRDKWVKIVRDDILNAQTYDEKSQMVEEIIATNDDLLLDIL